MASSPFISVPGVINFREVGGCPISTQPGKAVRCGLIYRSADPSRATDEGVAALVGFGIKRVYDLRSRHESAALRGYSPSEADWEGIERVSVPVFRDQDYSQEATVRRNTNFSSGPEGFARAYLDILDAASSASNESQPFAKILSHLASAAPTPLLIHCSAGKDRTGVICALILALCGVDDDAVADEYHLTELGIRDLRDTIIRSLMTEELFANNPEGAKRMVEAQKESMLGTLKMIRRIYGSVERCVIDLKLLSAEGIEQLKRNLIRDVDEASA
ncbi:tyrosine phosphatase [Durotheca rogersii]|uniref:tyrosine phosphatase n=1 Tax=Durotheca rogersii TaxID=419775 RepID=UPI00221E41D5|nr:tyrosine phosphatase [Durotheca rogersii]KAI5858252.1 tyrosine phosphatase [Durotheca rogersii]